MPRSGSLLVVDDDRHVLESTADWLRTQGFKVVAAGSCAEAAARLAAQRFDVVVSDIRLADGDGFRIVAQCRQIAPEVPVILVTGYGTLQTGIEAIRAGAFDLLIKPLADDELERAIERALGRKEVAAENARLKRELDRRCQLHDAEVSIIGRDLRMQRVFELIDCIADTKATVLITGESGTGKSLIARAIHRRSRRSQGPFVEVACGALPETLLESELFGHVAGAYTGALGAKPGRFQQAADGTIFLDEIGTSSPGMQVKLLRVLQELEFEPVGSSQTVRVDTRAILATNENLPALVAAGRFRPDLYYRINVINIELPPLRERSSDIPDLANHFLKLAGRSLGRERSGFSLETLAALERYRWPGNVRELENVVERAVLLSRGEQIEMVDLPADVAAAGREVQPRDERSLKTALARPERELILEALARCGWNRNQTADALGINRTTLYKKMKRLGLEAASPTLSRP